MGTPILTEGFEGGVIPPAGWTFIQFNPVETWEIGTYQPHSGTNFANCQYDSTYTTTQSEWLITPAMDFTPYDQVKLSFWWFMSYYWGVTPYDNYDLNVKVSTDNGVTWTQVWNEDTLGVFTSWEYIDASFGVPVDLSAYTGFSAVKVAFEYNGYDGAGLGLDDITINGIVVGANDVGVTSITAPATGTATGAVTPIAKVKNFGSADQEDVPVQMDLTLYGTPTTIWSDGFETYNPGYYGFPAAWTNTTINTGLYGGWFMYSSGTTYSASTYPRIQEASSNGAAQDASLISPIIDCSALAAVNLQFTKYFFASVAADATFTVYGSDDGGLTWAYTLVTYTTTSSTAENLAITAWAAGQNDVRLRFRFESPADATLTSYLYFDNMWVGNPTGNWGPNGDNPPAGWTIERKDTTAWNTNHWAYYASSSYDMATGSARIYYVSPYVEIDDNLTSPSIDCSALSTVRLDFNCYFYTTATFNAKAFVEVSVDGGITWQVVDDYQPVSPGTIGYSIAYEWYNGYDITAIAAGESDVKVRFHFTRPASGTGGYWYLDNVRVHDGSGVFKYIETFDTGRAVYFTVFKNYIHDDWNGKWDWKPVRAPYYNNKWQNLLTGTSPTVSPHGGTRMAQYYSYLAYQGMKSMLYSVPINVAAANTLKMSIWMYHDTLVGAAKVDVLASHDGVTWETMATYNRNDGSTNGWYNHLIALNGYEDDTALQIAFCGTSDYAGNIYIDDVELFDPGLIMEYSQTVLVDVDSGATVDAVFPSWTPVGWHTVENTLATYDVVAETKLVGDEVPANNANLKSIVITYPYFHDIQLLSINSPATNGPGATQDVKATVKNIGQYPERNFFVPIQIGSTIYTTTVISSQDFETTNGGYTAGGIAEWEWGVPTLTGGPTSAHSGTKLWGTDLDANYIAGLATLTTPSFTVPIGGKLNFWHWYDTEASYDGGNVKISINGGAWLLITPAGGYTGTGNTACPLSGQPIWTGHVQMAWEEEFFDISAYAGSTAQLKFDFGADPSIMYPGWYIDDVKILQVITTIIAEYDESAAVATWLNPGQSVQLEYPDWTPMNLALGVSGDIEYAVQATALNSPDGNTLNNQKTNVVTLTYWHDIGIKSIVSPAKGGRDLLFHQKPFLPAEAWEFRSSGNAGGTLYTCQDNFVGLTAPIGSIEFWGLCLKYAAGWTAGNQNALPFEVKFYEAGATPGAVVATFPLAAITPVQFQATGAWSGFTAYKWTYDLPTPVVLSAGWISIISTTAPDGANLMWAGSPEGDKLMFQQGAAPPQIAGDCAFNMSGTASPTPPIGLYLAPGVQPISNIVKNLGVFVENGLICYGQIWSYVSSENGTLVWNNSVGSINLNPNGDEKTLAFGSYNFQDEGIFGVKFNLPLASDDAPANNMKSLGIGIDKTKPVTTHTIAPTTPDGQNGWYVHDVTVTLAATDPKVNGVSSGVAKIEYQVDGGSWQTYTAPFKVTTDNAAHVVKYKATDKVGNVEVEKTVPSFKIDKTVPLIAMNYTWEKVGAVYNIIVTATCSDAMSGMGKVEFYFNGELQETVTGAGPDFVWTYQFTPLQKVTIKAIAYDNAGLNAFATLENPTSHPSSQQSSQQSQPVSILRK